MPPSRLTLAVLVAALCVCIVAGKVGRNGKRKEKMGKGGKVKMLEHRIDELMKKVNSMSSPVHVHLHGGVAMDEGHAPRGVAVDGGDMGAGHHGHTMVEGGKKKSCPTALVNCFIDPCTGASCPGVPEAVCRPNYCGGCNAEFWTGSRDVTKACSSKPATDESPDVAETTSGTNVHIHLNMAGGGAAEEHTDVSASEAAYAQCQVYPNIGMTGGRQVKGMIQLRQQPKKQLELKVELSGFGRGAKHGFHLHEFADFRKGCSSFGGHYNPHNTDKHGHGGHAGDWGNITSDRMGKVDATMTVDNSLHGAHSIVGRGIVIHSEEDDHQSASSAGGRIACCVIGRATAP